MTKAEAKDKLKAYLTKQVLADVRRVAKSYVSDLSYTLRRHEHSTRGDDVHAVFIKGEEQLLYLVSTVPTRYRRHLSEPEWYGVLLAHCRKVHRKVPVYLARVLADDKRRF